MLLSQEFENTVKTYIGYIEFYPNSCCACKYLDTKYDEKSKEKCVCILISTIGDISVNPNGTCNYFFRKRPVETP